MISQILPTTGYVRIKTVLAVIPICRASWWAGVKSGKYPRSYKLGRCTMWKVEDINQLIKDIEDSAVEVTESGLKKA